ncbi:MAG: ABC transporter permease, partial [Deltaproteobacteria bacterium]|nr:ABC transporter permease [Deltaproteobacteria bacterium]
MMLMLRLALRNARRNLRRTVLTATTVVFGTAMIILAMSWVSGIFGELTGLYAAMTGHIRVVDTDFAAREELQPLYENIEDVEPMLAALRDVPGVVAAEPRIVTGVVMSAGEEIGDDFGILVGASERYYREYLKGPELLVAGTWLTGDPGEVVLGRKLANEVEAQLGDEVLLLGQTQYGSMSPISAKVVG